MASQEDHLRHRGPNNRENSDQNGTDSSKTAENNGPTPKADRWDGSYGNPGGGLPGNAAPYSGSSNHHQQPRPAPRTAHEHALAVQQWMWMCQVWHSVNYTNSMTFSMYAANMMSLQQRQGSAALGGVGMGVAGLTGGPAPPQTNGNAANGVNLINANGAQPAVADFNTPGIGVRFRIPSLWKRVTAEFIDFFVLFLIKLFVTILTVEYGGIVDIQKYDLDLLLSQNIDYNTAFAMTSELIAMEIINRIFICIFETLCLRRGVAGTIGGTTPGKSVMGLRVVSCEHIYDGPGPRIIRVLPAGDIGIWNALVRSVIKNFSLAFFFPVCFTVFFFQHNRAAYDIISNCIVVELT